MLHDITSGKENIVFNKKKIVDLNKKRRWGIRGGESQILDWM